MAHWGEMEYELSEDELPSTTSLPKVTPKTRKSRVPASQSSMMRYLTVLVQKPPPDFSTLPVELLCMVIEELNAGSTNGNLPQRKIKNELFTARLVCKLFARIATTYFHKLTTQGGFLNYTTLHLPLRSGNLAYVKTAASGQLVQSCVRTVIYHIRGFSIHDVDEAFLSDIFADENSGEKLVARNLRNFRKLVKAQSSFIKAVLSANGQTMLRMVFQLLPNLTKLKIDVGEFWNGCFADFQLPVPEENDIAFTIYQDVIPAMLKLLPRSSISELELQGFGTYSLGGLAPVRILDLCWKGFALSKIRSLHYGVSHRDDVDGESVESGSNPRYATIKRADRLNLILHSLTQLEDLTLSCVSPDVGSDNSPEGDAAWLSDVLQDQHLIRLTKFSLYNFHTSSTLITFFSQHATKLRSVTVTETLMTEDNWLSLLEMMRNKMSLTEATIKLAESLVQNLTLREMSDIIREYSDPETHDVGRYVVKTVGGV